MRRAVAGGSVGRGRSAVRRVRRLLHVHLLRRLRALEPDELDHDVAVDGDVRHALVRHAVRELAEVHAVQRDLKRVLLDEYERLEGLPAAEGHAPGGVLVAPRHGGQVVAHHAHLHEAEVQVERDVVAGVRVRTALQVDREPLRSGGRGALHADHAAWVYAARDRVDTWYYRVVDWCSHCLHVYFTANYEKILTQVGYITLPRELHL